MVSVCVLVDVGFQAVCAVAQPASQVLSCEWLRDHHDDDNNDEMNSSGAHGLLTSWALGSLTGHFGQVCGKVVWQL